MQTSRITMRPQMTEDDLLAAVIQLAGVLGWKHHHPWLSVKSTSGYPDLTLVRPARPDRPGRVIWAELKGPRGIVSDDQQEWPDRIRAILEARPG